MDGTVTKILKVVRRFLLDGDFSEHKVDLLGKRVDFAIELNMEIDTAIDKMKEVCVK